MAKVYDTRRNIGAVVVGYRVKRVEGKEFVFVDGDYLRLRKSVWEVMFNRPMPDSFRCKYILDPEGEFEVVIKVWQSNDQVRIPHLESPDIVIPVCVLPYVWEGQQVRRVMED